MGKFVCKNCNYQFESELKKVGTQCAYCGEKEIIIEPSADDILKIS